MTTTQKKLRQCVPVLEEEPTENHGRDHVARAEQRVDRNPDIEGEHNVRQGRHTNPEQCVLRVAH